MRLRVPEATERLARDVARAVAGLRGLSLAKPPGIAEALDWTSALTFLGVPKLDPDVARGTIGAVVKQEEDLEVAMNLLAEVTSTDE